MAEVHFTPMAAHSRRRTVRLIALCLVVAPAVLAVLARPAESQVLTGDPVWITQGEQQFAAYGVAVSGVGDVNGDGYDDVLVGASLFDGPTADEGRIFLYLGSSGGLSPDAVWFGEGNQREAWLGFGSTSPGDVNGDGYADILAGAHGFDDDAVDQGAAYIWYGSPSGLPDVPSWQAQIEQPGAFLGQAVTLAGDVNGDGYDDVVVGAFRFSDTHVHEGAAFLHLGSASGPSTVADWSIQGGQEGALLGFAVSGAGDVNGDGYDDVLVGAHLYDGGFADEGKALLYLGTATGLSAAPAWTVDGGQASAFFGHSVAGAGDVNRDGYDDVLIGAHGHDGDLIDEGRAYLFLGSSSGLSPDPVWVAEGDQQGAAFAFSVSAAGDVNRDGFGDLLVGVSLFDVVAIGQGRAVVYLGGPDGPEDLPAWSAVGAETGDFFGGSVASAGDVNGDGHDDVVVGAQAAALGQFGEGLAYAYLGVRPSAFALRISRSGNGTGTVTSDPPGIDCGADCDETYADGTQVALTAIADPGSVLGNWEGDDDCMDALLNMVLPRWCVAVFHLESERCIDGDGDGFGSPGNPLCPMGGQEDCDDLSATSHPGAPEVCDGLDNSCDGNVDVVDCTAFDADGDGLVDGVELAWLGRAFGSQSADPPAEWWHPVDYTSDGRVDGDDLGILGAIWSCQGVRDVCE